MTPVDVLDQGRRFYGQRMWREAYTLLTAADEAAPLGASDLESLAVAAHMTGRDDECVEAWARAHQEWLRRGDAARAVRCAWWLAFGLFNRGESARAGGWIARARRLIDDGRFSPYQKLLVAAAALLVILDGADNQLLANAIPAMMREWGLPRAALTRCAHPPRPARRRVRAIGTGRAAATDRRSAGYVYPPVTFSSKPRRISVSGLAADALPKADGALPQGRQWSR